MGEHRRRCERKYAERKKERKRHQSRESAEEKVKLQGGKRSKKERRESEEYSRLVFQLITTEGPGAAVRHIFFTNDFFYYKH